MAHVDPQQSEAEILKWFDEIRAKVVEHIRRGDSIEFTAEAGIRHYGDPAAAYTKAEYNGTRTYTIKINGGARETEGWSEAWPISTWRRN